MASQNTQRSLGDGGKRKKQQILKLPSIVAQLLFQLRDLVEFVEEPLVDGRQLMDAIDVHATMEGLGCREKNKIKLIKQIYRLIKKKK